ncbi:MAG TPA: hypothetical protein DCQ06_04035, partial [Myxococcales bacterium]|nr:hypothetical protein [Myxococcales bacterium]
MDALERYGRQILVDDVTLAQQMSLAQWSIAPSSDDSTCANRLVEASTQYLVGAGIGRLAADGSLATYATELDSSLKVGLDECAPPVIHIYAASRSYGLSVDLLVTASARDWQRADADDAFVSTLLFDLGQPAQEHHAVHLGATVAEVIVNALLDIEPWPAVLRCHWSDSAPEPHVTRLEAAHSDPDACKEFAPAGLL